MKNPSVSIIIPFFNASRFLKRAIDSVKNQTYNSIEIILIDDGSTDNSLEIATSLLKNYKNYKLISSKNNGPGAARNLGIAKATGQYITFLDADDQLASQAISLLVNTIIKTKTDLSVCMYTMLDSQQKELKKTTWEQATYLSANEVIILLINEKIIPTVWGKLFKSTLAKKSIFPEISWKEDDVFLIKYLKLSSFISVINENLIIINSRNNSLTRQLISTKMLSDISYSYKEQFKLIQFDTSLKSALIKNKINTFLTLFLILKIDLQSIVNKKEILSLYYKEIDFLLHQTKKCNIGNKKRILLYFLKASEFIGETLSFKIIGFFKKNKLIALKKIKS